jgi:hypothetical protein
MTQINSITYCDRCIVEITWSHPKLGHLDYCCQDCMDGLPCECGFETDLVDDESLPIQKS